MSNLIDEKGNEIGHPEQFDLSIYEEKIKVIRKRTPEEEKLIEKWIEKWNEEHTNKS